MASCFNAFFSFRYPPRNFSLSEFINFVKLLAVVTLSFCKMFEVYKAIALFFAPQERSRCFLKGDVEILLGVLESG